MGKFKLVTDAHTLINVILIVQGSMFLFFICSFTQQTFIADHHPSICDLGNREINIIFKFPEEVKSWLSYRGKVKTR